MALMSSKIVAISVLAIIFPKIPLTTRILPNPQDSSHFSAKTPAIASTCNLIELALISFQQQLSSPSSPKDPSHYFAPAHKEVFLPRSIQEDGLSLTLPRLVERALANGIHRLHQVVDPRLASKVSKEHKMVEELLKLASSCTCTAPEDRPDMDEVLSSILKLSKHRIVSTQ